MTVGTGVGGGIVLNGQLHRGAFGVAAEIGHMRVVPDGRLCGCGNRGCWEQYASGTALVRDAKEQARQGSLIARSLLDRAGGDVEGITGPMITEAARDGDSFASEQLASLGRWLGEGIASLAAVLDPAVVVIGGGVSEAGDLLLDPVRAHFAANLTGRHYRPELQVRPAPLGNRAGMIGAATSPAAASVRAGRAAMHERNGPRSGIGIASAGACRVSVAPPATANERLMNCAFRRSRARCR